MHPFPSPNAAFICISDVKFFPSLCVLSESDSIDGVSHSFFNPIDGAYPDPFLICSPTSNGSDICGLISYEFFFMKGSDNVDVDCTVPLISIVYIIFYVGESEFSSSIGMGIIESDSFGHYGLF